MSSNDFAREIAKGLSRAYADSVGEEESVDLSAARLVIFSDHHKGARDGADDFRRCEPAYNAALAYYFDAGHRLYVLGDVEELWECEPAEVLPRYEHTLALERRFHDAGRYVRFFGNHDDAWRAESAVKQHLETRFPGLRVREALRMTVLSSGSTIGSLFMVHGHQGTADSDRFGWFSHLVVRHIWRPLQRKLNIASTTSSRNWQLRERHESAMYDWARAHPQGPVVIAGHTHRPVFWTSTPDEDCAAAAERVRQELERAQDTADSPPERLRELRAELEYLLADERRRANAARTVDSPCYFNTGCCSFGDGDITGLEIADGEIRLIRWPDREGRPRPLILARRELREVLEKVNQPAGP